MCRLWRVKALDVIVLVCVLLIACSSSSPTSTLEPTATAETTNTPAPTATLELIDTRPFTSCQDDFLSCEELHLHLDGGPFLQTGQTQLTMDELDAYIKDRVTGSSGSPIKWTLYIPDKVDLDLAIQLFQTFVDNGCTNVAVYAEDSRGDWPKREIGVEVGLRGPVRVITQFRQEYPESLQKYTGAYTPENLLVAKLPITELDSVLTPLLSISEKSHVRVQEFGGLDGMPAERYLEVLAELKSLGLATVSFYGVYIE